MARSKSSKPVGQPELSPTHSIPLLREQISKAAELLQHGGVSDEDYERWKLVTKQLLAKAFGQNSPVVTDVMDARGGLFTFDVPGPQYASQRADALKAKASQLHAAIELLQTEAQLQGPERRIVQPIITGHRIFLVHGRDERYVHEVARFLEKLRQHVVVLRDEPNRGRTIIEKFEDYADVGFAVVLLTPDDHGGLREQGGEALRPRARQNVIFELGYFIGKLSRKRVCALYVDGVEIPSDYSGVAFVRIDESGAWRLQLARELKAAAFDIDMNLAL